MASFRPETFAKIWELGARFTPRRTRETLVERLNPEVSKVSNKCGNLCERPDWLAGAGGFEPPNGAIKICLTTLIARGFRPDWGQKRPCCFNRLPTISRLPNCRNLEWVKGIEVFCAFRRAFLNFLGKAAFGYFGCAAIARPLQDSRRPTS
jgi:hypothetical protein